MLPAMVCRIWVFMTISSFNMKPINLLIVIILSARCLLAYNAGSVPDNRNKLFSGSLVSEKLPGQGLTQRVVRLKNIELPLIPEGTIRGDSDFSGCGPMVYCEVKIRPTSDQTELWADIYFRAEQDSCDRSTAEGRWSIKIFDVPKSYRLIRVLSDHCSKTTFVFPSPNFELLAPGVNLSESLRSIFGGNTIESAVLNKHGIGVTSIDSKSAIARLINFGHDQQQCITVPSTEGTLVKFFTIAGNAAGKNSRNNGENIAQTGIARIEFFPIAIEIASR